MPRNPNGSMYGNYMSVNEFSKAYRHANPERYERYRIKSYIKYLTARGYVVTAPAADGEKVTADE